MKNEKLKKVLTIAGSDSGAGAGIQADLRTFFALGVYGMSAITAVTAQNTRGIVGIKVIPAKFVADQIDAAMLDDNCRTWKTGMLVNGEIIEVVADGVLRHSVKTLIVDPVLIASSGRRLLEKSAERILIKKLFPLATVVTPNIDEAEVLTGSQIRSTKDMKKAAAVLSKMGTENVVVKGGHLNSNDKVVVDILYDGRRFYEFALPRIKTRNTHGTGCTFASAIAAELAKGKSVYGAVSIAKEYVREAIRKGARLEIGKGAGPIL